MRGRASAASSGSTRVAPSAVPSAADRGGSGGTTVRIASRASAIVTGAAAALLRARSTSSGVSQSVTPRNRTVANASGTSAFIG